MFGSFKKLFSQKTPLLKHQQTESTKFLTDPDKIFSLLSDLKKSSILCSIYIEGSNEVFSSSILQVKLEESEFIFDELTPKNGNDLLMQKNNKIKLTTSINRVQLSFLLSNIKRGQSGGVIYNKTPIPERIYYPQRRSAPRVHLNSKNILFSGKLNKNKIVLSGFVFDLSRSGIGITVQNPTVTIEVDDILKDCKITIYDHTIHVDLTIRLAKKINSKNQQMLQIGTHLDSISTKDLSKLEHFITSLERQEIRKRKD